MSTDIELEMTEDKTIIERLNNNEEVLKAMLSMPDETNESMVISRREALFSLFWENYENIEKSELLENIEMQEDIFIEKYKDETLPNWLLRMEAQDILIRDIGEKILN